MFLWFIRLCTSLNSKFNFRWSQKISVEIQFNSIQWEQRTSEPSAVIRHVHWDVENTRNKMWDKSQLSVLVDQFAWWTLHLPVIAVRQPRPAESVTVQSLDRASDEHRSLEFVSRHLLSCALHSKMSGDLFTGLNCGRWGLQGLIYFLLYITLLNTLQQAVIKITVCVKYHMLTQSLLNILYFFHYARSQPLFSIVQNFNF